MVGNYKLVEMVGNCKLVEMVGIVVAVVVGNMVEVGNNGLIGIEVFEVCFGS